MPSKTACNIMGDAAAGDERTQKWSGWIKPSSQFSLIPQSHASLSEGSPDLEYGLAGGAAADRRNILPCSGSHNSWARTQSPKSTYTRSNIMTTGSNSLILYE